jgi:hypothetical protein
MPGSGDDCDVVPRAQVNKATKGTNHNKKVVLKRARGDEKTVGHRQVSGRGDEPWNMTSLLRTWRAARIKTKNGS